eukprot:Colp12_sorted_trinity150504_noHs@6194
MSKLQEGQNAMKEGEKALKTGLFKWTPDFESAAQYFEQAANCFRAARALDQLKEAYLKASECHVKTDSLYHAGKALENAAQIAKDNKNVEEAAQLYERACGYYHEHGAPDSAALTYEKAARMLEPTNKERAAEFYLKACDIWENEDKQHSANESFSRAVNILMKSEKYDQVAEVLKRFIACLLSTGASAVGKPILSLVIVQLKMGDSVAATKTIQQYMSNDKFVNGEECELAHKLVAAFDDFDQEAVTKATSNQAFAFLDNEVCKLARSLRVPGGTRKPAHQSAGGESAAPGAAPMEEEEEDSGIC